MLNIYKTEGGRVVPQDQLTPGCWVNVVEPTQQEIAYLTGELGLDQDFVRSSLDEEESSRIEAEDNDQVLVIVDLPVAQREGEERSILYTTAPMGIILTPDYVFTISTQPQQVVGEMADGRVKNVTTHLRARFLLSLLFRIATRYLTYLKQIDKISSYTEQQLHKSMRNKELIQLLGLEVLFPQAHRLHAAADVHPHQVGHHPLGDGHSGAHGAARPGVDIRHHPDAAALGKLLAAKKNHLGDGGLVHHVGKNFGAVVFSADFQHNTRPLSSFIISRRGGKVQ